MTLEQCIKSVDNWKRSDQKQNPEMPRYVLISGHQYDTTDSVDAMIIKAAIRQRRHLEETDIARICEAELKRRRKGRRHLKAVK